MLTLLTIFSKASAPYLNAFRRTLAESGISPLTIIHAPNLIGHPIGLLLLLAFGMFAIPTDPLFFFFWFAMIGVATAVNIFSILGLLETKFFTTQIIGSLGFVSLTVCASIFLNESLRTWTIVSLLLSVVGVVLFSWKDRGEKIFVLDRGMIFIILSVILSGLSGVLHKLAALHTQNFTTLFTGRFLADLIGWTIVWLISMITIRRSPTKDFTTLVRHHEGKALIAGVIITTFIDSWVIFYLPLTTIAIIGTIAFPVTYFISVFKYKERITHHMWLGTLCIVSSIILFLLFRQ